MYGTGFFVVSSYALVHALRPVRNAAQPDWAALIVGLAVVIILIGAAGLFSVAPCWHFLGEIPSQCVAPSYREPFGSYVIGGTGDLFLFSFFPRSISHCDLCKCCLL